jgi:hypothetical protein
MTTQIGDYIRHDTKYGIIKDCQSKKDCIIDLMGNEYNTEEIVPFIIKHDENDTEKSILLKGFRSTLEQYTFRKVGTHSTRIGFSGAPFFFGFTGKNDMYHMEVKTLNHPEIHPTVIYYQAGNYSDLMLDQGIFEFDEIYDRQISYPIGTYMMGIVQYNDGRPKYAKWSYAHDGLYLLYILIMFGESYYIFKGMTKQQIIDLLEARDPKLGLKNKHYYQAYALVCYYGDDIPPEYDLDGLKEKIVAHYSWLIDLWKTRKNLTISTNLQK